MPEERHTIIIFIIVTTLFILILIAFIVFILFLYQRRHIAYQKDLETLKSESEKALLTTQLEIQEQTLQNISREIHDNIGLSLTLAKLNLNTIEWKNTFESKEKVSGSVNCITQAIEELSNISKALHTDYIREHGLLGALELELNKMRKLSIFELHYNVTGTPVYMQDQKELVIFRTIQEVLNNCVKHSEADTINVLLDYKPDNLLIKISDNGKGFIANPISGQNGKGTGLMNITKRTSYINGSCHVDTMPGKGTIVTMEIPY